MIEKAYAKINLGLNVLDKREDGYHNLETIILPLKLHDTLEITFLPKDSDDFVTCDEYSLRVSKYNICHRAIEALRRRYNFKEKFRINIHKSIFVQSGLGGGSADAAATIRGICKLLNLNISKEELEEIGLEIGADVPWALTYKPSIIKDVGTVTETFEHNRKDYVLIVKPLLGLSTAEVFLEADNFLNENKNLEIVKDAFINDNLEELKNNLHNDLEKAATSLLPELEKLKHDLLQEGFDVVSLSGSGSSYYCLTKNKKLAKKMEKKYSLQNYQVELTTFL